MRRVQGIRHLALPRARLYTTSALRYPHHSFSRTFPPRPENDIARSIECKTTLNETLAFSTIREATQMIRDKEITPLDLVR